jgi:hypothetical protein
MQQAVANRDLRHSGISRARLWFGLLGGASAWTIHLFSAYAIAEFGCVGRLAERSYGSLSVVAWLEVALTVAMLLVAAAATAVAYRSEQRLRSLESTGQNLVADSFTARAGLLASGIFTFVILFESIPILFYLRDC